MLVTTFNRTRQNVTSYVVNAETVVMGRRHVDVGPTLATTSVSVLPVTMVADYVTSATVRTSSFASTAAFGLS